MHKANVILFVDDDTTVLTALRTLASKMAGNNQIEIAESGIEALEIWQDIFEDGRTLGVVVSDFIMPGMRGDELLVRLHQKSPDTVKIMLTGQSDLSGVQRAINEAELYRFLEKPFNNADLAMTLISALEAFNRKRETEALVRSLRQEIVELKKEVQSLWKR